MGKIRVLFFGTPDFAIPSLAALVQDDDFEVAGVITNLDRPAGRGMDLRPPPIKNKARDFDIPVFQTDTLRRDDLTPLLGSALNVDIAIVVACGFFIPKWLREGLPLGAVNLHPSLLPELRGAAPVNWAIIRGYEKTGITVFKLVKEMDAGPIIRQEEINIGAEETAGQLLARLSKTSAGFLTETVKLYSEGKLIPNEQDDTGITYAPKITRKVCAIDWVKPAREVYNLYRGLAPRPGVYFDCAGDKVKVSEMAMASGDDIKRRYEPGETIEVFDNILRVACGSGAIDLIVVRPPGKTDMSAAAFARGRGIAPEKKLG